MKKSVFQPYYPLSHQAMSKALARGRRERALAFQRAFSSLAALFRRRPEAADCDAPASGALAHPVK